MSDSMIDLKRNRKINPRKENSIFLGRFPNNSLIKENRNKYPFISQKKVQGKNILVNYLNFKIYFFKWGLGIGDWGLGIGDWEIGRAHV